jgi:predicted nucleotidyltransferase
VAQVADDRIERFRGEVLPCLRRRFAPERVIVFGSRARGDAIEHSDLDVLVVAGAFRDVPWLERAPTVTLDCDIRFGVELLCYTPDKFERKREEWGIVRTAVREGFDLLENGD